MKKISILLVMAVISLYMVAPSSAAKVQMKPFHADLECSSCHGIKKPVEPPKNSACLECHGDMAKLVEATSNQKINPHTSPHWGTEIPCATCHKEHKPSRVICAYCHSQMPQNLK